MSWAARLRGPVPIAAAAATLVAVVGAGFTELGDWYRNLVQPAWKPPDWAFGPAWTLIFALAAAAGVIGWRSAPTRRDRTTLVCAFAANGVLNALWSLLYFKLRRPDWAAAEVVLLWLSVLLLIVLLVRHAVNAAWLLVPYFGWVGFAGALNWATVQLNGPFGR